jgi:negative regulator of genetic competence, sporulation and motility
MQSKAKQPIDVSIYFRNKSKHIFCDAMNDLDSEQSFNDFGTFRFSK